MSAVLDLPVRRSIQKIYSAVDVAREQQATVILSDIPWENYDRFADETVDNIRNPLFYYESGNLLIMTLSAEHERVKDAIVYLINLLCEEFQINSLSFGSATYRRRDIQRGFEPDACFYFENESKVRGVKRLDMSVHPAPDMIVEIDITSLSTFREQIFSAFSVPEIIRFDGENVWILKLDGAKYVAARSSAFIPFITSQKITEFVNDAARLGRLEWIKTVREWARLQAE